MGYMSKPTFALQFILFSRDIHSNVVVTTGSTKRTLTNASPQHLTYDLTRP